jgi:hypothetical protein
LLVDAPTGVDVDKATPYISFYEPERIINWDAGRSTKGMNELDLVVLDESGYRAKASRGRPRTSTASSRAAAAR